MTSKMQNWIEKILPCCILLILVLSKVHGSKTDFHRDVTTCCDISRGSNQTKPCPSLILEAGAKENFGYTPLFPKEFPMNKKCIWTLRAPMGMRVRLEFRDFYLIGPSEQGCYSQKVMVHSPVTGLSMGPFCGNAGIPTIISGGNLLTVELISAVPMTDEKYRGFRMAYRETLETTSHSLRGDESSEKEINAELPTIPPAPPPGGNNPPIMSKPRYPQKPSRWVPNRRPFIYTTSRPMLRPLTQPPNRVQSDPSGNGRPIWADVRPTVVFTPSKKESGMRMEVIVGIVLGAVIFVCLLALIAIKLYQIRAEKKKEKGERTKDEEEMFEASSPESTKKEKDEANHHTETSSTKKKSKSSLSHSSRSRRSKETAPSQEKKNRKRSSHSTEEEKSRRRTKDSRSSRKHSKNSPPPPPRRRIHVYEEVEIKPKRKSKSRSETLKSDGHSSSSSKREKVDKNRNIQYKRNDRAKTEKNSSSNKKSKSSSKANSRNSSKNLRTRSFVLMAEKYRKSRRKQLKVNKKS